MLHACWVNQVCFCAVTPHCHGPKDVDHLGNGTEWRAVRREATHVKVSNPLFCRTAEQMNLTSSVI